MRLFNWLLGRTVEKPHVSNLPLNFDLDKILEAINNKEANRTNFWNMLSFAIPRSLYKPPQDRQTQILNLACGPCIEGDVLNSYFGNKNLGELSDKVIQTGIDIDEANESIRLYPFKFVCDDLTKPAHAQDIPTNVDIVVIRHQQCMSINAPWKTIFKQAVDRVSENGIILITSYGKIEHDIMVNIMRELGAKVILDEATPNAKSMGWPNVFMDGNVAIFKK